MRGLRIQRKQEDIAWMQRALLLAVADVLSILLAYFFALFLRFDFIFSSIPREYLTGYLWSMPFWVIVTLTVFYGCKLYHSIWRLASLAEFRQLIRAYGILLVVYLAGTWFMRLRMPKS